MEVQNDEVHEQIGGAIDIEPNRVVPLLPSNLLDERHNELTQFPFVFPVQRPSQPVLTLDPVQEDRINLIRPEDISNKDVLIDRYARRSQHPGNISFQALIQEHMVDFNRNLARRMRRAVAMNVVSLIRLNGGRFLSKDLNDGGMWFETGDQQIIMRVMVWLRQRRRTFVATSSYLLSLRELAVYLVQTGKQQAFLPDCFAYLLQYMAPRVTYWRDGTCHIIPLAFRYLEDQDDVADFVEFCVQNLSLTAEVRDFVAGAFEDRAFAFTKKSMVSCLLAVLMTKLHIRAEQSAFADKVQCFLGTQQGQILEQVSSVLVEMAEGTREYQESQEQKLQPLMFTIEQINHMILPALVYPEVFARATRARVAGRSVLVETQSLLDEFFVGFERISGAHQVLMDYVGEQPLAVFHNA